MAAVLSLISALDKSVNILTVCEKSGSTPAGGGLEETTSPPGPLGVTCKVFSKVLSNFKTGKTISVLQGLLESPVHVQHLLLSYLKMGKTNQ